ncbi:MAG: glutamine synthetase III [Elusimicrobiota bacterium]|jgi:glutamine synthetase
MENGKLALFDEYGHLTFNKKAMARHLSKQTYGKLLDVVENGEKMETEIADEVAHAMKEWAISLGATHFCHWFQPQRGLTAEKHDSFLSFDEAGAPIDRFSGRQLIQSEPDASSFPSGGMRSTFEARGYTAWDPTSPAFILHSTKGATLVIPSVYLSWTGEVLDMKTPLLRALRVIEDRAFRVLKLFGNRTARNVRVTLGPEQEYFLVAKEFYRRRPDLIYAGRTLFGAASAKQQQMEDHYFGSIQPRVLDFMTDLDGRLFERGIPAKTRHNEVAPNQFELAPIFETANLALDHNLQIMEIMRKTADEHGFALLLHEKPFSGINGSGKHMNWSLSDSEGNNLLEPGVAPKKNLQFLVFLSAFLSGVNKYGGLLRAAVADAGNDHRLGANEAPPAIMSVYLGEYLDRLLNEIEKGSFTKESAREALGHGLKSLPSIVLDNSDRNRTSPIAFTGNKFEFRAVGSSQSLSEPATAMCLAVAHGLDEVLARLEKHAGKEDFTQKALETVRELVKETKRVRFEGNGYSEEWHKEAARRGLPNDKNTPQALKTFVQKETVALYERYRVLSKAELEAKHEIKLEAYVKLKEIELRQLKELALIDIAPTLARQVELYGAAASRLESAKPGAKTFKARLAEYDGLFAELHASCEETEKVLEKSSSEQSLEQRAQFLADKGVKALERMRSVCDAVEAAVEHKHWPLPKYREMLFLI